MARTELFRAIRRALSEAAFASERPACVQALREREAARRDATPAGRRAFLRASLHLGVAAPVLGLTGCLPTAVRRDAAPRASEPICILGGGVSGLTAAYRLGQAGLACTVYEGSARLNGRIWTQDRFNDEGMFCELGGELIDSTHADLLAVARELAVPTDDFRPDDRGLKRHQFYFGKQRYYDEELTRAAAPLARHLLADMKQVFDDVKTGIVTYDRHRAGAKMFDRMSLAEYLHGKKDVDRWVLDALDVAYLGEFGLETSEQSAINLMSLINPDPDEGFGVFGDSDEAMRIRGGNGRLIDALAIAVRAKNTVELDHQLVKIERAGGGLSLTFLHEGKPKLVRAGCVICTIPFSVLRELEGVRGLGLSPLKQRFIAEFGYGTNAKRMLGFRSRPWRKAQGALPASTAYSFTDLPAQCYWDSSRAQAGTSAVITNFVGGKAGLSARAPSKSELLRDLDAIQPGVSALHDGKVANAYWIDNPYARGSYACPKVGQYTTLVGSAATDELGGALLFAGEHTSVRYQGYMNGAVQSANEVVRRLVLNHAR